MAFLTSFFVDIFYLFFIEKKLTRREKEKKERNKERKKEMPNSQRMQTWEA